ncbi:MAG: hypothetical protein HY973_00185 [Candidatus Kerfeldbacteria bacterium]|nr:hypothetical protein [Candidatus Kerfeldbacteria bacterium]
MTNSNHATYNQSGTVLLLALLVLASLLGSSIALGSLVIGNLQQAKNIDDAVMAYYGAESGIEKKVYDIRKSDTFTTSTSDTLSNHTGWTTTVRESGELVIDFLQKDKSIGLDLYNFDDPNPGAGIESVYITWQGGTTWLEIKFTEWSPGSNIAWPSQQEVSALKGTFIYSGGLATNNSLVSNKAYHMEIKALRGDASDINLNFYDIDDGGPACSNNCVKVNVPNRLEIDSTGTYGKSRRVIRVNMPRKTPMSSLYEYVLFTERSLTKGAGEL